MTVRAVAVESERSNAIGAVELSCTKVGLSITYRGVAAYQEGYAPAAVTAGTHLVVPWTAVREASLDGARLFLRVDEALTPHHRLMLAAFSTGSPPDPAELRRRRLVVKVATGGAALVLGLLVALTAARLGVGASAVVAIVLGCLAAGLVAAVGVVATHRLGVDPAESDGLRLAFATELSAHLPALAAALHPTPGGAPGAGRPLVPTSLPSFQALLPRTTTAMIITMSAALLGAVLTASWVSRQPAPEARTDATALQGPSRPAAAAAELGPTPAPPREPAAAAPAPPLPAAPAVAEGGRALLSAACTCPRADSLLWRDGLPRLSIVLIERRETMHHGHPHLELEIGVVNNYRQSLPEVSLVVQFYERDPGPSRARIPTHDRPLFFEGPLAPGQAVKWHVEARGNDFEVTGPREVPIDPLGTDAAPNQLVAELLHANHRPMRLHGAMLLAFLGDARAKEGALALREALREDEAPYIDRLMWTLSDVRTCAVTVEPGDGPRTVRACVQNISREPREQLALRVRALDRPFRYDTPVEPPPIVLAEHIWKVDGRLAPGQGALVTVALDTHNPDGIVPQVFEAYADRDELVH